MPADSNLSRLVPVIYEAAEDPALWPEVLNQISDALHAVGQVFTIDDLTDDKSHMTLSLGLDPAFQDLYNRHYESLNLHLQRARPLLRPGRVLATHNLCTDQETIASEYYQEFLRPQEDRWFHVVGGCVEKEHSLVSVLSFMRGRAAGRFTDQEIQLLEDLMPHLRRAVRLHQALARHKDIQAWLDVMPVGALLVDGRGRVHFANRRADGILQTNDGIGVDQRGCLHSRGDRLRDRIAAAHAALSGCGTSSGGVFLLARPSGRRAYVVSISPVRQANPFSLKQVPGAVILIRDPEEKSHADVAALGRLYNLTAAETRIASLLAEGNDITEICARLQIRRTTVRTHLRRISGKLGVRRQAQIVSVILKILGPLPSNLIHLDDDIREPSA